MLQASYRAAGGREKESQVGNGVTRGCLFLPHGTLLPVKVASYFCMENDL